MKYQLTPLIHSSHIKACIQPYSIILPVPLVDDIWKDRTVLELLNFWMPKHIEGYTDVPAQQIRHAFLSWKLRCYTRKQQWLSQYGMMVVSSVIYWLCDLCQILKQYPNADFTMTFRKIK